MKFNSICIAVLERNMERTKEMLKRNCCLNESNDLLDERKKNWIRVKTTFI